MKWAPGDRDMRYEFEGRRIGDELVGEFKGIPRSREDNPVNDSVHLRRVSEPPADKDIGRSGYYANVIQHDDGDYGGMEFLFIDLPSQPVARVAFYEGTAGPPWAAQELVVHGDTLRFIVRREGRDDSFEAIFRDRAVVLSSRTLDLAPERLTKRATIAELAQLFWEPGCPESLRIK